MKSQPHNPGTGAAAAHRHRLGSQPAGGTSAAPGLAEGESKQRSGGSDDAAAPEVFGDLRRRNERRARLLHLRLGH